MSVIAEWTEADSTEANIEWARKAWADVEPEISTASYVNHLAGDDSTERVRASFGGNYARLAAVKRQYDASNLFRLNANIVPA